MRTTKASIAFIFGENRYQGAPQPIDFFKTGVNVVKQMKIRDTQPIVHR